MNPYGTDRPAELPELAHGSWTDKWFGAVLTVTEFDGDGGLKAATGFIADAMSGSLRVLSS